MKITLFTESVKDTRKSVAAAFEKLMHVFVSYDERLPTWGERFSHGILNLEHPLLMIEADQVEKLEAEYQNYEDAEKDTDADYQGHDMLINGLFLHCLLNHIYRLAITDETHKVTQDRLLIHTVDMFDHGREVGFYAVSPRIIA